MMKKLRLVALVVAAAALIAGGCGYIAWLTWHLRSLQARLETVEAALKTKANPGQPAVAMPAAPSKQGAAPPVWISPIISLQLPPHGQFLPDDLERRVEKIEKALTPHLELLPLAPPDAPGLIR